MEQLARTDPKVWAKIVATILRQPKTFWEKKIGANIYQVSNQGNARKVIYGFVIASWITKLRNLPCIKETHGSYKLPAELLGRSPATESLFDLELFVDGSLDVEKNRRLLQFLGVRYEPPGPDRILDHLRALTETDHPPTHEIEKLYRKLRSIHRKFFIKGL